MQGREGRGSKEGAGEWDEGKGGRGGGRGRGERGYYYAGVGSLGGLLACRAVFCACFRARALG